MLATLRVSVPTQSMMCHPALLQTRYLVCSIAVNYELTNGSARAIVGKRARS